MLLLSLSSSTRRRWRLEELVHSDYERIFRRSLEGRDHPTVHVHVLMRVKINEIIFIYMLCIAIHRL